MRRARDDDETSADEQTSRRSRSLANEEETHDPSWLQQQIAGVHSGMARAATAASRSEQEQAERLGRRQLQRNEHHRERRRHALTQQQHEPAEPVEHAWQPPSMEVREELRAIWRGDDDTAEYERHQAERCIAASPPRDDAGGWALCTHGLAATDDWHGFEGVVVGDFSSNCDACLSFQLARRACEAALSAVAPDEPPDPDEPWGTGSADCCYDNGSGERASRQLTGGLSFALPDELYGAEQHGGRPARERKRAKTSAEEPEADWAPSVLRTTDGSSETFAKPGDFYLNYGAKERVEYGLMMDNGAFGDTRHVALLRWLDALPEDVPQPPPFDEAPPRRGDYPQGSEGRASYHADRAEWYRNITGGQELEGILAEQNALFDRIARRYRAYSDGRADARARAERAAEAAEEEAREEAEREAMERALYDPGSFTFG